MVKGIIKVILGCLFINSFMLAGPKKAVGEAFLTYTYKFRDASGKFKFKTLRVIKGQTAITDCAINNREEVLRNLLVHNPKYRDDINKCDSSGLTPLGIAAFNGSENIIRLLLHYGADQEIFDGRGFSALGQAIFKKHKGCVKILLNNCNQDSFHKIYTLESNPIIFMLPLADASIIGALIPLLRPHEKLSLIASANLFARRLVSAAISSDEKARKEYFASVRMSDLTPEQIKISMLEIFATLCKAQDEIERASSSVSSSSSAQAATPSVSLLSSSSSSSSSSSGVPRSELSSGAGSAATPGSSSSSSSLFVAGSGAGTRAESSASAAGSISSLTQSSSSTSASSSLSSKTGWTKDEEEAKKAREDKLKAKRRKRELRRTERRQERFSAELHDSLSDSSSSSSSSASFSSSLGTSDGRTGSMVTGASSSSSAGAWASHDSKESKEVAEHKRKTPSWWGLPMQKQKICNLKDIYEATIARMRFYQAERERLIAIPINKRTGEQEQDLWKMIMAIPKLQAHRDRLADKLNVLEKLIAHKIRIDL